MDKLSVVFISGFAVAYLTEFLGLVLPINWSAKLFKNIAIFPLSYVACWFLDMVGFTLVVSGLATAFVATTLTVILNLVTSKPQQINRRM
jgi:hypothetical protein